MRERSAEASQQGRDISIPSPRDYALRVRLERSVYRWLEHYFPDLFFNPFNRQQKRIIQAVLHAARHGGDQSIAAPRGEGKTSISECVVTYCVITGRLQFPLIVAATGPDAQAILANIKRHFETNDELREQYPEVCCPVWELEGASQRANMQTCFGGHRTRLKWGQDRIVFADVPDFRDEHGHVIRCRCRGSVLMTRGLDSAIRGIRYGALRPDLVLIDDPETRESVESETQIAKRTRTIEQDIGGLGGPGRRMGRLLLCTIMNRIGVAYQYTDPSQHPSWRGVRYKLLVQPPEREDLWGEYTELRRAGMSAAIAAGTSVDDAIAQATQFYVDRRSEMDAGAVVANAHRYDPHHEISALQHCYNIIADQGQEAFLTEYQNDPPETAGPQESGIYPDLVASRVSGFERGVVPPHCPLLTGAVDIGKTVMHWVVTAWCKSGSGTVIDYGVHDVFPRDRDNEQAIELAILQALYGLRDSLLGAAYCYPGGEIVPLQCMLIDSGRWERPVYEFVRATGQKLWRPSKGIGEDSTGRRTIFRQPDRATPNRRIGEHCVLSLQEASGIWLVDMDTPYWKGWLHERFMTPPDAPQGCLTLFGSDKRQHTAFAHHICSEIEIEEFVDGRGLKRFWKKVNRNNHWLDATYAACVAASLHGMQLLTPREAPPQRFVRPRKTLGQQRFLKRPGGWIRGMR